MRCGPLGSRPSVNYTAEFPVTLPARREQKVIAVARKDLKGVGDIAYWTLRPAG